MQGRVAWQGKNIAVHGKIGRAIKQERRIGRHGSMQGNTVGRLQNSTELPFRYIPIYGQVASPEVDAARDCLPGLRPLSAASHAGLCPALHLRRSSRASALTGSGESGREGLKHSAGVVVGDCCTHGAGSVGVRVQPPHAVFAVLQPRRACRLLPLMHTHHAHVCLRGFEQYRGFEAMLPMGCQTEAQGPMLAPRLV